MDRLKQARLLTTAHRIDLRRLKSEGLTMHERNVQTVFFLSLCAHMQRNHLFVEAKKVRPVFLTAKTVSLAVLLRDNVEATVPCQLRSE